MQSIGMVRPSRIAQFAAQGFIVFAPYYRGNRGERDVTNLQGRPLRCGLRSRCTQTILQ